MTEIDVYSLLELEDRRREREALEAEFTARRRNVTAATIDTIRELHSRGYTDDQMAKVLGVQRKVVNHWRLHGRSVPSGDKKRGETPALNSAREGQGGPV